MRHPGRKARPGDSNHLQNAAASELLHHERLLVGSGELQVIGFDAPYEVRSGALQSLHQLEKLTLNTMYNGCQTTEDCAASR